ncbi:hypothetical protein [Miltoncostaea marina]|uniref:hypothetical protein n=1 Tax=Miltoncostaea marina TaxID=2843215 RepID=UPI001C3E8710|nr:hypothetical protein [Miltoncostaea marina]
MGMPMDVTAAEALIWLVHAASGHVAWLHEQVGAAEDLTAEQTAMLVTLYGEERDRLAQVAKAALDAGVDAGQVQLAQRWGRLMGELIKAVLDDLDLDQDQMQRAPDVVRYHLGRFNEGDDLSGMALGEG